VSAANQVSVPHGVACSESVFTAEIVFSAANKCSQPKIMLSAGNQSSLPNCVVCSEQHSLPKLCWV
jgi:hypothetical protein